MVNKNLKNGYICWYLLKFYSIKSQRDDEINYSETSSDSEEEEIKK